MSGILSMPQMNTVSMNVILRSEAADRTKNTTKCHSSLLSSSATFFFCFFFPNALIRSTLSHGGSPLDSNRVGLIDFSCSCQLKAAASNCAEYPGSSLPALFLSVFFFASISQQTIMLILNIPVPSELSQA